MRSLLAAVSSPAGGDDEEEEAERLPPSDPSSQHRGEALSFLSQLASYGQGLLEEVLVIDLKSPKVPRTTSLVFVTNRSAGAHA